MLQRHVDMWTGVRPSAPVSHGSCAEGLVAISQVAVSKGCKVQFVAWVVIEVGLRLHDPQEEAARSG